jgi:hypothetical protein
VSQPFQEREVKVFTFAKRLPLLQSGPGARGRPGRGAGVLLPAGRADIANRLFQETELMTLEHLADVRRKIADLEQLARILDDMAAQCDGGPIPECPVVDALSIVSAEA